MWKKKQTPFSSHWSTNPESAWIFLPSPKSWIWATKKIVVMLAAPPSTASGFLLRKKPAPVSLAGKNWDVLLRVPIVVALFIHPKCQSQQQHEKAWPGKQLFSQQHVHQLYHQILAVRFFEEWQLFIPTNISSKKDVFIFKEKPPCPPYPTQNHQATW